MESGSRPESLPGSLLACDLDSLPEEETDVLIVGAGIAGLSVAATIGDSCRATTIAKGPTGMGSTFMAQGGVAAALDPADSPEIHLADTLRAGAGLCDVPAVRAVVEEAADAVSFLRQIGVRLDQTDGRPALTIEGGHSRRRVVHAGGDATGVELVRALGQALEVFPSRPRSNTFLLDLLGTDEGHVGGALIVVDGALRVVRARAIVLASGGSGRLYATTTAPLACTGDGTAAAFRAGAALADLEFVQFHPTALHTADDPRPLISESLRGEGAILRDRNGTPVMAGIHPDGDLAPRDVVTRAMVRHMAAEGTDHLYLDATGIDVDLARRFPTITAACLRIGIDPAKNWIPVSPACHYTIGGIRSDPHGRTTLAGLFAVGETAASGIHGANRLASNSLLEGVVFGRRIGNLLVEAASPLPAGRLHFLGGEAPPSSASLHPQAALAERDWLRQAMLDGAGVVRDGTGLRGLAAGIASRLGSVANPEEERSFEVANLFLVAHALVELALRRTESRGAHFRDDDPNPEERWRLHQLICRRPEGTTEITDEPVADETSAPKVASSRF